MTDVLLVGGGLVGLATAHALTEAQPTLNLTIIDKEDRVAHHQSRRNSGVLHAGVYYRPGSAKARLCRAGKARMEAFCEAEGVPVGRFGKVIVATSADELPRLDALAERARANGVTLERIGRARLRRIEPHATGLAALWVEETAVTDFGRAAERLADRLQHRGVALRLGETVEGGAERSDGVTVETDRTTHRARVLVTCAGLWADRVARLFGAEPKVQLVPFRGEYAELRPEARHLVRGLIYPVPNPSFPFLGVHLTRMVDGRVEAGPSAALAFERAGYRLLQTNAADLRETLSFSGFRRLAAQHWRMGLGELARSVSLRSFLHAAQRLLPSLTLSDLTRAESGVRAQALFPDGTLADDFVIEETPRAVHVVNAPSPAATASFAIGEEIAQRVLAQI